MSDQLASPGGTFWSAVDNDQVLLQFETLVNMVDAGIYQLDTHGRFAAINDRFVELTGRDEEELLGAHASIIFGDHHIDTLVGALGDADQPKPTETIECPVRTDDGTTLDCEVRHTPVRGTRESTGGGVIGVTRRVSTTTSEQLPVSSTPPDHTLAGVLDELDGIGVFILDEEFQVAWINETIERFFGLDRETVVGQDKRQLVDETILTRITDHDTFRERVFATYDDNSYIEQFDCHVMAGDGQVERWLEHLSRPIDSGPYSNGRIELYYDVTDQRRRASQLRYLNEAVREWLEAGSLEEVAEQACTYLADILDLEINGIFLRDESGAKLHLAAWTDAAEVLFDDPPTFAEGEGIAWRTFKTGRQEIYGDVTRDPDVYNPDTPIRSEIILSLGDHGVVLIGSESRDAFDDGDLNIAKIIASTLEVTFDSITRQRKLEARTTELETELGEIFGRITDAFYALDDQWRFTHLNDRAAELIDFDEDGLIGKTIWETFEWAASSVIREEYERAMETQESTSFEVYYPEPLESWFEVNAYPSATGLSVYFQDVTERKRRERKLEESERRYRALVEHFPNGAVALVDKHLRYHTIGGNPHDVADVTAEEIEGVVVPEAIPDALADELVPRYESALDGETSTFETEFNGRFFQFQIVPVRDDDGDVFAALGMSQDITTQKEREQRLGEVVSRLEESNRRLEQFAYAASHDLQEPLRMVSSYLQLIEDRYEESLGTDGKEFLAFALDGAERMREMINGLLQYSRVETQGKPLEPVGLDVVFEEAREDLQIRIEESNATITVEELPVVQGDAGQLRQVFQNLLKNAIEYSGDRPPRIHVSTERDGSNWIVSISDDGVGIHPKDADRIFEVFQRLYTQDEHSGTGIGLALSKRIVERHGGEIWVDSAPGEGATFSFTLPADA